MEGGREEDESGVEKWQIGNQSSNFSEAPPRTKKAKKQKVFLYNHCFSFLFYPRFAFLSVSTPCMFMRRVCEQSRCKDCWAIKLNWKGCRCPWSRFLITSSKNTLIGNKWAVKTVLPPLQSSLTAQLSFFSWWGARVCVQTRCKDWEIKLNWKARQWEHQPLQHTRYL